ncbi:hypothetical protein GLS40_03420 [Pseudooceanicola sp. 216_PA32_1]|uniref:Uncharacterized protein n=1 Tax=Pseudooceanicola pacificus TaxID=2676438 RepID=A0A844VZ69_9RHOB|nr:hypothetical protein [Pseudooceanicola pacificus]MWB77066.1 hypothetical protein [Pseudooceanicola pacificus]
MTDMSTDHGMALPPGSSALVASARGAFSFFPLATPPDTPAPRSTQFLVAAPMRSEESSAGNSSFKRSSFQGAEHRKSGAAGRSIFPQI